MKTFHVHLVSDSTGETLVTVARACLAQFEGTNATEHLWPMVRHTSHLERISAGIVAHPGIVLFTLVDERLRTGLLEICREQGVPWIPVLDPVLAEIGRAHV